MTKEEIIDNLELYTVGRPKKDRVSITVEELQSLIDEIKVLEQQPTTQEILSHIETGITATGQSDSYCVGFCNALIWLKACITHEEPHFFKARKVGKWIKEENTLGWDGHSYQCSVCGRSIHLDTEVEDLEDYPYCHCGAEMEIGEDGKWIND